MPGKDRKIASSSQRFETIIAIIIVLAIVVIGILVHYRFSLLNFFFLPVIFSGYHLGRRRAILIAISCILLEGLYLVFSWQVFGLRFDLSQDNLILLVSWAIFLVLTAWIVGFLSERREKEVFKLKRAYAGILAIVLKFLEVGEEEKSSAEKVAELSGKIAEILELDKAEVENIKSAALLSDVQEFQNYLPLFNQSTDIMGKETLAQLQLTDQERVMLNTATLILSEIRPLLQSYYVHYRQKANEIEKSLNSIPVGASIIALAELYLKLMRKGKVKIGPEEISSPEDIRKLKGRYFPERVIEALYLVV